MSRHDDLINGSKFLGNVIAHELKCIYTNYPEKTISMEKEQIEYRGKAISKLLLHKWNNEEIAEIKESTLKEAMRQLNKPKYKDIRVKISDDIIRKKTEEEIFGLLNALK